MAQRTDKHRQNVLRAIVESREFFTSRGIADADIKLAYCLFGDRRCWTISAISDATGMARPTVRTHLRRCERKGYVRRNEEGACLTDKGSEFIREMLDLYLADKGARLTSICTALKTETKGGKA